MINVLRVNEATAFVILNNRIHLHPVFTLLRAAWAHSVG